MEAAGGAPAASARRAAVLAALVFVTCLTVYVASWQTQRTDSVFVMHTALSIARDGDLDISEYGSVRGWRQDYFTSLDGRTYMDYPAAVAFLAAPFALAVDGVTGGRLAAELDQSAFSPLINQADMAIASFYSALAAVFIFLISRRLLSDPYALAATAIFAFGTAAWSTTSRGLWMQGPSMLLLAVALYVALLTRERPALAGYLGIPLAAAYMVRPTNAVPALFLTIFVLAGRTRYFTRYLAWGAATLLPFVALNLAIYGTPLAPYHTGGFREFRFGTGIPESLAGTLLSPGRGLFVYSPVLLLSLYGAYLMRRDGGMTLLDRCLAGTLLAHWAMLGLMVNWEGGYCYGPRLFADMLPFLIYFMLPALKRIQQRGLCGSKMLAASLAIAALASLFMNFRGATSGEPFAWSADPPLMEKDTTRLWDWRDPPFLRGL